MTTSLYAAILAIMLIALSLNVIIGRRKFSVALEDKNNIELKRRIRAQANFSEYSSLFIILSFMLEYNGSPTRTIHALAMIFIVGRLMHAYSILSHEKYENGELISQPSWRILGMMFTLGAIGISSTALIFQYALNTLPL